MYVRVPVVPAPPGGAGTRRLLEPFPHPQVCCKQPDPPPHGERVPPDSWVAPHCREMERQGKSLVRLSRTLWEPAGNAGLGPEGSGLSLASLPPRPGQGLGSKAFALGATGEWASHPRRLTLPLFSFPVTGTRKCSPAGASSWQ